MAVPTPDGRPAALRPGAALVVAVTILALTGLLAAAVYLAGRMPWDDRMPSDVVARPEDVAAHAAEFEGRTVTVTGRVTRVLDRRAFAVGGVGATAELLVVPLRPVTAPPDRPADTPVREGDAIRLTGEVRIFGRAAFEQAARADLDDAVLGAWEGLPAVLAGTVELSPPPPPRA